MMSRGGVAALILSVAFLSDSTSAFIVYRGSSNNLQTQSWGTTRTAMSMSSVATGTEALATYERNMEKMRAKDKTSTALTKEDLKVVYDDDHIVVIDKPAGVLCVPDKENNPSLAAAVFDSFGCESGNVDKMVAQRLGFDTSGLVVFAKTDKAIKALNAKLRSRKMTRKYEALLCGDVNADAGEIDFALQRDPAALPFMRVYTEESQQALIDVASDLPPDLDKKLCRNEQPSLTKYEVVAKEELGEHQVTRVMLTSVSGRTHQLNVHCAAFGHPIVGDTTYGINGDASPNGGLDEDTMNEKAADRASAEVQASIASIAKEQGKGLCIHLKELSFKHPETKELLTFESKSPF